MSDNLGVPDGTKKDEKQKMTSVESLAKKEGIPAALLAGFCEEYDLKSSSIITKDDFFKKLHAFKKKPCGGR